MVAFAPVRSKSSAASAVFQLRQSQCEDNCQIKWPLGFTFTYPHLVFPLHHATRHGHDIQPSFCDVTLLILARVLILRTNSVQALTHSCEFVLESNVGRRKI